MVQVFWGSLLGRKACKSLYFTNFIPQRELKESSLHQRLQALRFEFKKNNRSLDRNRSIVAELYEPSDAGCSSDNN